VHRADGKWAMIYCHWDGYFDHNGVILAKHYASQKKAEKLVAPGDMSSLGPKCSKPKGHTFDKPVKGYTVYYGRDRGEKGVDATVGETLSDVWPGSDSWTEFTYVWTDEAWWVGDPEGSQTLILLSDALEGKKTIHPAIKAFGMVLGHH
jgi:hypothetical protein